MSLLQTNEFSYLNFLRVPISISLGVIVGVVSGLFLVHLFKKLQISNSIKVLLILSTSFLLIELQNQLTGIFTISGLIAIIMIGITIRKNDSVLASQLSGNYNQLWIVAEIVLFVLVGVSINAKYLVSAGIASACVIFGALIIRMLGVYVCLFKSAFNKKERIFCMGAYTPKATVQAAISALPLSAGLACGQEILTISVLAIILTAPLGSIFIEKFYRTLLERT